MEREPTPSPSPDEAPATWLVDAFNVLHAGLLAGRERGRWWSAAERSRLVELAAGFDDARAEVVLVFDGAHPAPEPVVPPDSRGLRLRVVFAESADDWVVAQVRTAEQPGKLAVVTRDRRLADRSRHRGARVVSPRAFLARCHPDGGVAAQEPAE